MKNTLDSVLHLKLSWLLILPYNGGKLGGWVSENYMAIGRLLKWVFSSIEVVADDKGDRHPKGGSVINIVNMVISLYTMITYIMSTEIDTHIVGCIERHIKISSRV